MAIKTTDTQHYKNIADAIRSKTGSNDTYKPGEMAAAIRTISTGIVPTGTLEITSLDRQDVSAYRYATVSIDPSLVTRGNKYITENGENIDVASFATVTVNVPRLSVDGNLEITENGNFDVSSYATAEVNISAEALCEGSTEIRNNGTFTVAGLATVDVNVETSAGATGTITITENVTSKDVSGIKYVTVAVTPEAVTNGTLVIDNDVYNANNSNSFDVTEYKEVEFNVSASNLATGSKTIIVNGTHNVAGYATVNVNVPAVSSVSGTFSVTNNGIFDISGYAQVEINVPPENVTAGNLNITKNGVGYNVAQYKTVSVDIPISEFVNMGTLTVNENNTVYNVAAYDKVNVQIPSTAAPTGSIVLSQNGIYNVSNYANVQVDVTPEEVMGNGVYVATANTSGNNYLDVTNINGEKYRYISVNVPASDTASGTYTINNALYAESPDRTFNVGGFASVKLNLTAAAFVAGTRTITANAESIDVTEYQYVTVNVPSSGSEDAIGLYVDLNGYIYLSTEGNNASVVIN